MNHFKNKYFALIVCFALVLAVNYLSASGVIFPYTQAQISDKYTNVLAPAGFTFSIWGIIYLGVILMLIAPFRYKTLIPNYSKLMPMMFTWMLFNVIWIITWSYDLVLLAFLAIIGYTVTLIRLTSIIHQDNTMAKLSTLLVLPIGLHTGWLMTATWANLMTLLVKLGFDGTTTFAVFLTVILLIITLLTTAWLYQNTRNHGLMLPVLWALVGIGVKHLPSSHFEYRSNLLLVSSGILLIIGIVIYLQISTRIKTTPHKI